MIRLELRFKGEKAKERVLVTAALEVEALPQPLREGDPFSVDADDDTALLTVRSTNFARVDRKFLTIIGLMLGEEHCESDGSADHTVTEYVCRVLKQDGWTVTDEPL